MDIQFILSAHGCASYITSYVAKGKHGMSDLLRTACKEAKQGNVNLKQQVCHIGNKFLDNVEMSAQEAVYLLLQLPLRRSSRKVVFINTSPPEDRVYLLKSRIDLLPDNAEVAFDLCAMFSHNSAEDLAKESGKLLEVPYDVRYHSSAVTQTMVSVVCRTLANSNIHTAISFYYLQESLTDAKVNAQQQFVYEDVDTRSSSMLKDHEIRAVYSWLKLFVIKVVTQMCANSNLGVNK